MEYSFKNLVNSSTYLNLLLLDDDKMKNSSTIIRTSENSILSGSGRLEEMTDHFWLFYCPLEEDFFEIL